MEHPDKSLNANLFITSHAKRLMKQTPGMKLAVALAKGSDAWNKSGERVEMLRDYQRRGFGLEDSARERKENGGKPAPLKASLFEIAGRRR